MSPRPPLPERERRSANLPPIRLRRDQFAFWKRAAKRRGIALADLVRQTVDAALGWIDTPRAPK